MPAGYWWSPIGTADFTDPGDWMKGPGVPWDRYTLSDPAPGPTSDLYFDGGVSVADCVIPTQTVTTGENTFAGIHLVFGLVAVPAPLGSPPLPPTNTAYSGTVTLSNSFPVGTLEVDCGATSQGSSSVTSGNGSTLTITSFLDWTGGTLNNNSVAGIIALAPGASGVAEPSFTNPGINGTVTLGSTLLLQGNQEGEVGSNMEMNTGVYNVVRSIIQVAAPSILVLAPVPKGLGKPIDGQIKVNSEDPPGGLATVVIVDRDAKAVVKAKNRGNSTGPAVVELSGQQAGLSNEGRVELLDKSQLFINPAGNPSVGVYLQSARAAVTVIEAGSGIEASGNSNVEIQFGSLELQEKLDSESQPLATQEEIYINAPAAPQASPALKLGSDAVIERHAGSKVPLKLSVTGVFDMNGQVKLMADSTVNLRSDLIEVTKKIEVGSSAKVSMQWFDVTGTAVGVNDGWILLQSIDTAANPITAEPQFEPPAGINGITLLVGERTLDKKKYNVRREQ